MISVKQKLVAKVESKTQVDPTKELELKLNKDIENAIKAGEIDSGSIYVKDLASSKDISINIDFKYTPASLLKLPLAMSIYKLSERQPDLLQKKLIYNEDPALATIAQSFEPDEKLKLESEYTVEELVRRMLVYSDNASMRLLLTQLDDESFIEVYEKQGVPLPSDKTTDNYMIARDYVSFFGSLHRASYVSKTNSDKILDLLSQTTFEKGLALGVPPRIRIAHKFGEREVDGSSLTQLHDCGIVYAENSPYIICVMLKGEKFAEEENLIGKLSEQVYSYMSTNDRAQ